MENIKKKLLNTAMGELVSSMVFIYVYTLLGFKNTSPTLIPLIVLVFILIQGSLYWFYTLYLICKKQKHDNRFIIVFKVFNIVNRLVLIISLILIFVFSDNLLELIVSLAIYIFGLIEYINYYCYRLSYGKSGFNLAILFKVGLKKSSINKLINKK